MKAILLLSALAATFLVTTARFERVTPPTYINRPTIPPQDRHRFRREANPNPQDHGSISATVEKPMSGPERRPSYSIDYQHNIWQGKNGEINAGGGASKMPGQRWDPHIGIQGTYRWKREASPQFTFGVDKPAIGQPSYNLDYQHNIFQNKNAQLDAGVHGQKFPSQDWGFNARAQGSYQQRNGQLSAGVVKPLNGPDTRPSYNVDYQHNIWQGKNGQISAGVGADKFPGQHWQPRGSVRGTWRIPG